MKIVLVSDCFLPEVNGISYCVQHLGKELTKKNEVIILAPSYGRVGKSETRFTSIGIPLDKMTQFVWPNIFKLNKILRKFRPDVVHIHTLGVLGQMGIFLGRKLGIRVVLTYHTLVAGTLASYPGLAWTKKWAWRFSVASCNRADVVITPAVAIRDELIKHGVVKKIVIVGNGIETNMFRVLRIKKEKRIIYVGRIGFEKGVDILVEAMKRLAGVELVMIGEGPAKFNVSKNVKLVGKLDRSKLPMEYAKSLAFVTAAEFEVNPLVVLEAMACGLPVIAANRSGMRHGLVVDGVNGFLVDEVTPEKYAQKIKLLIEDEQVRIKMGLEARKTAEENDVVKMGEKTLGVYEEF